MPFEYLIRLYTTISNPDYLTPTGSGSPRRPTAGETGKFPAWETARRKSATAKNRA